jgi:prolipoprotein diacylglyceryltransferase
VFLFWYWSRYKINLPEGRIFGIFMIILWSLRFAYEFLKENQVSFEDKMPLNMGQILSIPLVLVGVFILIRSYKKVDSKQASFADAPEHK